MASVKGENVPKINALLDRMLEQGNQLRASELIPVLKAIVEALPSEYEAEGNS